MTTEELADQLELSLAEVEMFYDARDDEFVLFEAVHYMNTHFPDLPMSTRTDMAKSAIQKLLDRGWIALYVWSARSDTPLTTEQSRAVIADPRQWESPIQGIYEDSWRCGYFATEEGQHIGATGKWANRTT